MLLTGLMVAAVVMGLLEASIMMEGLMVMENLINLQEVMIVMEAKSLL